MPDKNIFTDKVKITIKSGDGGDGMNSFKAFKGKPACGPDGGDGGNGGAVYIVADGNMGDLLSFRYTSKFCAGNGERGGTNKCFGRGGDDVIIKVPVGTVVKDADTGTVIADMFSDSQKKLIAEGAEKLSRRIFKRDRSARKVFSSARRYPRRRTCLCQG